MIRDNSVSNVNDLVDRLDEPINVRNGLEVDDDDEEEGDNHIPVRYEI